MAWAITDISEEVGEDPKTWKTVYSNNWDEQNSYTTLVKFRLLDDDGNIYAYGVGASSSSFAPLDHYGLPMWGAVDIQYFENNTWESL